MNTGINSVINVAVSCALVTSVLYASRIMRNCLVSYVTDRFVLSDVYHVVFSVAFSVLANIVIFAYYDTCSTYDININMAS